MKKLLAGAAVSVAAVVTMAAPAFAFHCENVSKNPAAAQGEEKDSNAQGGGRSWNSGATGMFFDGTYGRNFLVNGDCGGDQGVQLDGFECGEVNPGEFYKIIFSE